MLIIPNRATTLAVQGGPHSMAELPGNRSCWLDFVVPLATLLSFRSIHLAAPESDLTRPDLRP
jgi:hypothetical protein